MTEPMDVFKTAQGEALSRAAYDSALVGWPVPYESLTLGTRFGATHVLACGAQDGPPLILLHGQEASATMWRPNIAALSQAYRVYALDTLGDIGKSRPIYLPETPADYTAWLRDCFCQLGLDHVSLVGLSYGGFLALNFALACPCQVKQLALLAPGIPNFGPPTWRWAFYGLPMLAWPSRRTVTRFINAASVKGYTAGEPVYEQMIAATPQLRQRMFLRPKFTDAELGQVRTPTLLLIGEREMLYQPAAALARASQLIPNLTACLVSGAGHMLNYDQPEVVNQTLLEFLAGKM